MSDADKNVESSGDSPAQPEANEATSQVVEVATSSGGDNPTPVASPGHVDLRESWTPVASASTAASALSLSPDSSALDNPSPPVAPPGSPSSESASSSKDE